MILIDFGEVYSNIELKVLVQRHSCSQTIEPGDFGLLSCVVGYASNLVAHGAATTEADLIKIL